FFFQAEDGIRDFHVTGVQTCALPIFRHFDIQQAVIFCNTKQSVEDLSSALKNQGFTALALHGDMEQRDRDEIYVRFKNNSSHFRSEERRVGKEVSPYMASIYETNSRE